MSDPTRETDHTQLLQTVLMRAAANRAAQISRQEAAALVREIKQRNQRMAREN